MSIGLALEIWACIAVLSFSIFLEQETAKISAAISLLWPISYPGIVLVTIYQVALYHRLEKAGRVELPLARAVHRRTFR